MVNTQSFFSESFSKEEILKLYNEEFKKLSHEFTIEYIQNEEFKENLKHQIRTYMYSFFDEYKSKYKSFDNHFDILYKKTINEHSFLNSLVEDYVASFTNDILNNLLGAKKYD